MYLNLSSLGNSDSAEIWGTSASSPELLGTLPATVQCYEEAEEALAEGETSIGSCIRILRSKVPRLGDCPVVQGVHR
jgi:hypothetical protein